MSEAFNPFAEKPAYTKEQVGQVFGPQANSALASRLYKENRPLYDALKQLAQSEYGFIAKPTPAPVIKSGRIFHESFQNNEQLNTPQRVFSDEEVRLRIKYDEATVRAFWRGDDPLFCPGVLAKSDPAKFAELRAAATAYDILPPAPPAPQPVPQKPKHEDDGRFELSAELCQRANLPAGYRVTADELATVLNAIEQAEQARQQEAEQS